MSIAAGLSFTGCGNSGSTGSTFEQVPLIGEDYACAYFEGANSGNTLGIDIVLQHDGTLWITIITGGQDESFSGSGRATQLPDNTYQIEISDLSPIRPCTCGMTCNGPLVLTIPADQLEDYRKGQEVTGATLYVDFTHESQCPLNQGSPWTIKDTMTGNIQQKETPPPM